MVPFIIELCCYPDLFPRNTAISKGTANLVFTTISKGGVYLTNQIMRGIEDDL